MDQASRQARTQETDLFFSLSLDLLCIADFDGRFLRLNPAWQETLGFSIEELQSRPYIEFVHPEDRENTIAEAQRLRLGGATWSFENRYRSKDGSYKWLRWTCASDPTSRRLYAIARNVTELRRLQEDLRLANETLEDQVRQRTEELLHTNQVLGSLIDACPHAIVAVDTKRNVTIWNNAATQIFGWTVSEVLGAKVPFVTDETREESNVFNQRALRGETFTNHQMRRARRDGGTVDLLVSAAPLRDSSGAINGFLTVATDITEQQKLEQQFLRAQRLESLGTLASGIAHDLNNVLAPIGMAMELIRMKFPGSGIEDTLDLVDNCVTRGADLIRQVLTFVRGVRGQRVAVQTRHLLLDTARVLAQTLPKSITINSDIPRDLWSVQADPTQIHQVFMNLCLNARDAMSQGGRLTITARNIVLDETYTKMNPGLKPGPYAVIEILDTGHGIPAEILDKVFEAFFTTKDAGKGTGIGLSTVAAIVRNHGGCINLYSEVGRGTSFKIYFPALTGDASESRAGEKEMPIGTGELILIVDDEAAVRDIAKLVLETHGYRVIAAQDGGEGVAVYAKHVDEVRLVISDLDMPVMSGTAMIRSLERINPDVRVISASGLASNGRLSHNGDSSRFRRMLSKPYTASDLLRTVDEVLKAS